MSPFSRPRLAMWLFAGFCAGVLFLPARSHAADPVDRLRRALRLDGDNAEMRISRRKEVEAASKELQSVLELRRGYLLPDWAAIPDDDKSDKVDMAELKRMRDQIHDRLKASIKRSAESADLDQQLSVALWIGDVIEDNSGSERSDARAKLARTMTPIVLDLLKQKNLAVRQAALHSLGRIAPEPAQVFPVLRATLKTDAVGPRRLAAYALSDLVRNHRLLKAGEQAPTLVGVIDTAAASLNDADDYVRGYALQAIQQAATALQSYSGEEVAFKEKGKVKLKDDLREILKAFKAANPAMLKTLADPKTNVRAAGVQAFVQIANARFKIAKDLLDLGPDSKAVLKTFDGADPLGKIVEGDWKALTRLLREDDVRLRRSALEVLELLGEQAEPVIDDISAALADPDHFVRWSAVRTIRNVEPKRISSGAVRALSHLLSDPDPDVCRDAAAALEALGPLAVDAVDSLAFVVGNGNGDPEYHSWDAEIRVASMKALIRIGPKMSERAIPRLIAAVADEDVRIRRAAAETLGQYGPAAKEALPALRKALRDEDADVRLNSSEAILAITAPRKGL